MFARFVMFVRLAVVCVIPVLALAGCASKKNHSYQASGVIAAQPAPQPAVPAQSPSASDEPPLPHDPIANQAPMPMALLPDGTPVETAHLTSLPAIHSEDIYTPLIEAAVEAEEPYLLDTGDRVRVFVYGQPNLSRVYAIDGNGFIAMPLIGSVMARGLTTYDLSSQIARLLRTQYLRDPVVTAEITAYRPFYILGEVRNAGQYAYVPGMTVQSAVATAGGFGPRAYQKTVKLGRLVDGAHREIDVPPTYRVRPGDTIVVEERFF